MADESNCAVQFTSPVEVYLIPPRTSSKGHKASDWGKPFWSGRLRVLESDTVCEIRLEDSNTAELFASCPYTSMHVLEPVLDSFRFFVIAVVDQGRRAYLGIGFQERTDAFDFNLTLQNFLKRQQSLQEAKKVNSPDYSLKEGETFKINIGRQKQKATPWKPPVFTQNDLTFPTPEYQPDSVNESLDDDSWGEFQ